MTEIFAAHRSGCPHADGGSRPAVVVTDLDGTLLDADGQITERTLSAVREAAARGVSILFATARPAWSARAVLAPAIGTGAVLISSNGAVVSELDTGRITRIRAMPAATVRSVIAGLGADATWAVDREHDRLLGHGWPDVLASGSAATHTVDRLPDGADVLCLMVQGGSADTAARLGAHEGVLWTSSSPGLLEVSAPGADKVSAVASVLDGIGGTWAEVLAFGDSPNDAGLLTAAGRGVAVANACEPVLALADAVAPHHDDDGVAQWLEGRCLCPV